MNQISTDKPPAPTILIIDDDADIRALLSEFLEGEGYVAAAVGNGLDALTYLHDRPAPALILLDLTMPVMNGFQFREAQQSDPALAAIPVVVMAARGSLEPGMTGIAAVLGKPMDFALLLDAISSALRPATPLQA